MRKTNKLITILMLVAILTMSVLISTVNAATLTIGSTDSDRTVLITRNVNGVTNPVTNTFTYTIAQDTTYNSTAVTNYPTSATIAFSGVNPSSGTATANTTLDFVGSTFTKVGDYRFILTETGTTDSTKYPLDNTTYYLYVSVRFAADDTDGTKMVATVASTGIPDSTTYSQGAKEAVVFESEATFTYITVSKTVSGNMGDKSEYFDVTVNIPGETGATYKVTGGSHANNPTTVEAGTATVLKIRHGETITIGLDGSNKQIPVGTQYTVSEAAVQGYTTTIDGGTTNPVTKTAATIPTSGELPAGNKTAILNNYEAATLTGVFLNIMPYIAIASVVLFLILILKRSSKRRED